MNRPVLSVIACLLGITVSGRAVDVVETDVCIYGATSGGVTAAIQARRLGKSVVLISTNTHVGGMTTGGLGLTDTGNALAIGGLAREFYTRIATRYGATGQQYTFEPHVAEEEMNAMLAAASVPVRANQRLASVVKNGPRLTQIVMEDGTIFRAGMFIDTTYEGDLMAAAGVTWTLGRESVATYGESANGITAGTTIHNFPVNVSPYITPGNPASGLLPLMQTGTGGTLGDGDSRVQAYNYRVCLTSDTANQNPIQAPPGYDEARYELLGRLIDARLAAGDTLTFNSLVGFGIIPNRKTDLNNNGAVSTDYIGGSYNYATASAAQRAQIALEHLQYIQGFLYYLGHSTRVPAAVRTQVLGYGTCKDEFQDTGGWPHQLYVREARRMISDYVMLQQNCVGTRMVEDSVGLGSYAMDSHTTQRFVKNGYATNEGVVYKTVFEPYRIGYRSIVPRVGECENLLVPWSLSASHVAFGSIRMEPVFMILSQSAAVAAAFALDAHVPVQQVNYAKLALQLGADGQVLHWGSAEPLGLVIDNGDPTGVTITGTWFSSTSVEGYAGSDYLHDNNAGKGTKSIRFTPTIPATGLYDVYLRWTTSTNRATAVPVDITHAGGTSTYSVNQRNNGGTWYKLTTSGPLTFAAGTAGSLLVRTTGTTGLNGGYVAADSVRFTPYTAPSATVQIVASDAVAREADPADHARFTVVRAADQTANEWNVSYTVSGTATSGEDFTPLSGSVTIPAGEVAAVIDLEPIADGLVEGDETVTITLQAGAGFGVGAIDSATARIVDQAMVQIVATDDSAREADPADTARFTVSRPPDQTASAWTVAYRVSGTATSGTDFTALPGSVTIPAGQASATIDVTAIGDDVIEGDETVIVTLLPGAGFSVGTAASATAYILDKPVVQIAATDAIAREADPSDTARFTVSRAADQTANALTVSYAVSGTATSGSDFLALPGSVDIPAGQTAATIEVTAVPDDLPEGNETVTLTLLPSAVCTPGANASATVSILDQPIDAWRLATFTAAQLADPAISGDEADPDGDGIRNLTEYPLGLNPLARDAAAATTGWDGSGHLAITYFQRRSATDVTVLTEGSTDLRIWSAGAAMVQEVSRVTQGDFDVVTVRLVPLNPPSGFLRVRVTRP
jgi:hypothetical protein